MVQQRAMLLFEQAIRSEATKKVYKYQLEKFREWSKIKNYDGLLQAPKKNIQELLEDYVMYLKKTISPNSVPPYFAPIELFYVMNDVDLNFKRIRKLFPDKVKKGNDRGYTHDEINLILSNTKTKRNKALILLLASSGCRLGAIPDIKLKHIVNLEESYAIKIYEGDKEEDYIFTTPEATKAIDEYFNERRQRGEYFDQETPLFRVAYKIGIERVKPCTFSHLTQITFRSVRIIERKKSTRSQRYDVPRNHGFRKFFATVIKDTTGVSPTMTEKLINHIGIVQMDGAYYKPSMQKMFEAYKKAVPELTIDQTKKLKQENRKQKQELSELQQLRKQVDKLEWINAIKSHFLEHDELPTIETKDGKKSVRYGQLVEEYEQKEL